MYVATRIPRRLYSTERVKSVKSLHHNTVNNGITGAYRRSTGGRGPTRPGRREDEVSDSTVCVCLSGARLES